MADIDLIPASWRAEQRARRTLRGGLVAVGIGMIVLETRWERRHPELVAVSEPIPELSVPVWMLTHPDLRQTARVRAFMQHVGDAVAGRLVQAEVAVAGVLLLLPVGSL